MDEITADRILLAYEEYEDRFLKFLKMVPYNGHNAWSPLLVDLLLGVCGLLDLTFREMMSVGPCGTSPEKIRRKNFNITHYKKQFATDLRLKCARTLVLMTPPRIACPFEVWRSDSQGCPNWWTSYNNVKHDRLKNMESATADVTLNALCGMFTTVAWYPPMYPILLRRGWTDLAGHNPKILLEQLSLPSRWQPSSSGSEGNFVVCTRLFITTLGPKPLPDQPEDINPADFLPADRLMAFLGKGI